jgi:hypothetical protein
MHPRLLPKIVLRIVVGAGLVSATPLAHAVTVNIPVKKDNTLFEDPIGTTGGGASDGIYAGHTGTSGSGIRRALVQFDLSSIPSHATVTSATLTLTLLKINNGSSTFNVHRVLADWGEGPTISFGGSGVTAEPGDVTWLYRFYPGMPWTTTGGDFVAAPSASRTVGTTLGPYVWGTSAGLVNDVQGWISNPATNFGWVIRGNETGLKTAKKFASREYNNGTSAAVLTVIYTPPPPCTADKYPQPSGDHVVNIDDLLYVINSWGQTGPPGTIPPDVNSDGTVNIDDLLAVISQWGSCP